ncbi:ABC transporter permease [Candidatus Saccharibacteria bacterium]|nr:ABC transporter permease [Candidatus Saccharibacteria bacterium]
MFATLIATVIVFSGAEKSAVVFIKKSGNDKYLVKSQPNIPYDKISFNLTPTLDEIRKIRAFERQYYQDLQDKYKSLKLEYDKATEVPALEPYAFADKKLPEEQRVKVNFFSPVIQAMNVRKFEEYAKTAANKASDLREIGARYGASGYTIVDQPSAIPSIPRLRFIQDGKEDFGVSEPKTGGDFGDYGYFTHAIYNGVYSFTDQKNLSRYILPTDSSELKGIPVVVSAQEAASLFGKKVSIGEEPKNSSEKKTWLKDIQEKLNGQTYQACYRNSTEQVMLEKIQRDYVEMKNNENSKEYQKPSLIYDYPKEACGDITIKQDTRTAGEKQAELKLEAVQNKLGTYVAPVHKLLTFQIVGVRYAQPFLDYTKSVEDYIKSLLVSPQGDISSIEIPIQLYDVLPNNRKVYDIQKQEGAGTIVQAALIDKDFAARILEFSTVKDARAFLDNETCRESASDCAKRFIARPYGSNYLILDEISKLFNKISSVAFPVVLGLAAIIIWFTISRIMTENRKETAVYRAMGARRHDVATIYLLYVFLVALQIAIVSTVLGVAVAFVVDSFYGSTLSDTAVALFGIIDDAPRFSLFNIESPLLTVVVGSIFVISIIASIQPLIRNVRRNPISDMRDE